MSRKIIRTILINLLVVAAVSALALGGFLFWRDHRPQPAFDYSSHAGAPADVNGLAASRGTIYSEEAIDDPRPTLFIAPDNRADIDQPSGAVYNAIVGLPLIVENGHISAQIKPDEYYTGVHPRSAVGLNREKRNLLLFVVDGRQRNYSEGVTLPELAQIAIEYGADIALNLDGGGSSTLVVEDSTGRARVLNSPIDSYVPGRERPVGNHLTVYARKGNGERIFHDPQSLSRRHSARRSLATIQ